MKKINYYAIGGQYYFYCYGGAETLTGAKRIATANAEYWDNWQGWHIPAVYRAEDTMTDDSGARWPAPWARPVAVASYSGNYRVRWENVGGGEDDHA